MLRPVALRALPDYKLWLRYSDGAEGEVDLSDLAGRGVFKLWDDYSAFESARIGEHGEIIWNDAIDLCPDALYMKLTGKRPDQVFSSLQEVSTHS